MNAPDRFALIDVQSTPDSRQLPIQQVGVKGLRYPLALRNHAGDVIHTVATVAMTVGLPAEVKGTHMSRFVALLEGKREALSLELLPHWLEEMLEKLDADRGCIELRFPYFVRKTAPVSGVESLLDLDASLEVTQNGPGAPAALTMAVVVPVTSLCPCSKKISAYGAHNQRSHLILRASLRGPMALETLVRIAEEEASCEIFGLLKRPDEKWVTERAYDNPKFVEDLVRDVALRLGRETSISRWSVSSENFESIHNHSAYAYIEGYNGA